MEKVRLGKTDMMVPKLGFGGIPIQRLSEKDAVTVVRRCIELGVTFFDTANGYTTSEESIGKAIAGRRQELILATKAHARSREDLEKYINLSLKRLGTDYIDLYQLHGVSTLEYLEMALDAKGLRAGIEDARKAGKIKHIGITSHSMDVAKEAVKSGYFETLMFPFNFVANEPADELLPLCREHDVGFIAMKPMAGGMLYNATIAFKYLLQFPDIVMIPGIQHNWEIEEIAGIFEGPGQMTAEEDAEMQRLRGELGTRFCRRCEYCQPCSQGIPISTVMTVVSWVRRMPLEGVFSGRINDGMERATTCIECGDCEERCPYHLSIRETIAENVRWYEQVKKQYLEQAV